MAEIVTIGETMAAFTPKETGFLHYIKDYEMRIAGAESNLAIGAAKLGHSVRWISRLGQDEFGEFVRNAIRAEGVDTSCVLWDEKYPTGIMFKQILNASETSVFYYRENSAASHMGPKMVSPGWLEGCKILHITGITPVLSDACEGMIQEVIKLAAEHQIPISFDPNIRKKLWRNRDFSGLLRDVLLQAQYVLLGREEAEILLGTADAVEIRDMVFEKGKAQMIALKDGAKGAIILTRDGIHKIPPFPCNCIDPIGAGDAFNGAFLCGVLEGRTPEECGKMGAVAGALATETYGDIEGYPSRERLNLAMGGQSQVYR